jgi:glycosyltransferase involved in cell wall biosynthesis
LIALCRERSIDVIHTHDAASQCIAALAGFALRGTPILMTFHRSLPKESATVSARMRNAFAGWRSAAIITGSDERRAHFLSVNYVPARKMIRIPFGTDLARFHPDSDSRAAIRRELGIKPEVMLYGAIGHFGLEKGIDVAIRSFGALAGRKPSGPVALAVFGEGPRRPEIEKLAHEVNGSPGEIRLAGFREDMNRCMAALDVLIHVPRLEAFGLVVIEAMATGLPVVASRVGGIPELVRDNSTGLLAESDQPESFARALDRQVKERALHDEMGAEARRVALTEYGRDLYVKRHIELYQRLLAPSARYETSSLRTQ